MFLFFVFSEELVLIIALYVLGVITGWAVKRNDIKHIVNKAQSETKKELKELQDQIKGHL